ncbi:dynamin family protein [Microbispora sp. H13382]|uniref:dynamin family protein n=1 Tax=Microbispora sp. H13382 TaxID=2729112 RepID=UPI001602B22D|nr:dynamin family protein [Microbispora sp. H13382]
MSHPANGLADMMRQGVDQAKTSALTAIEGLVKVAGTLGMKETAANLGTAKEGLKSDTFNIIVMGRFKNGKSTLLNALMGGTTHPVDLQGHKGPMVVDDLPATAILTGVRYADTPTVKAWGFDGKSEEWPLSRYLRESTLDIDETKNLERFAPIREFEMGFPARLCEAGVVVYDSPGLDDHPTRTLVTQEASARCDAAVIVFRSDVLMGQGELTDAAAVAEGTRVFTVVNLWGGRQVDERLRGFVWNRYVRAQLGGPQWAGQDLASRDIYFVDAEKAREARYTGDEGGVEESGLALFERRLGDFLRRERLHVHLKKYAKQATDLATSIEQQIKQRRTAAQADQARLREAYAAILPSLTAIRARPQKIPVIFEQYQAQAQAELSASFIAEIAKIRVDLRQHMADNELPSERDVRRVFQQKKLAAEAADLASRFVSERIAEWGQKESADRLRSVLESLGEDLEKEIAAIGREFDEIHLELSGWEVKPGESAIVGTTDRVVGIVASLLIGNVAGAIGGGAGGWRGALGGAVGAVGAGFVLGVLGITAAPVVIPVALVAAAVTGIVGGNMGLGRRARKKASEAADEQLSKMPEEKIAQIERELARKFRAIEKAVTAEINKMIAEEERNIRQAVELNQRDQADRDRILASLTEAAAAVAAHRLELQRALTIAQQV